MWPVMRINEYNGTHLFGYSTAELPSYTGLHSEHYVVHLEFVWVASMFSVNKCI